MSLYKGQDKTFNKLMLKWLPAGITLLIIFLLPPVAIAIILAFFTAPLLLGVRSITKLPLTIATLLVMILLLLLVCAFTYLALVGIVETLPAIERHLAPFTKNTDIVGKLLTLLQEKIIEYGQAILEYSISVIQSVLQHLFNFFIFLIAFFFALRESGKERFWFLVYFPTNMRKSAKRMLLEASKLIGTFVSLEARLMFLTFIILTIGFSLLRFSSPIGIAFLVTLVDSIPFLGVGIFLIPMAAFFLHAGDLLVGISLILLYIFTITTRQLAESYMWASTFQLRAVHAFFIMASAIYLFGLAGILLTPFLLFAALRVKQHTLFTS